MPIQINPKKPLVWMMVFLFLAAKLLSQDVYYKAYNTSNGLPSTQVYDIKIDGFGNLWYATDFGVGRYDGFEFVNFTMEDGLPINSTIKLYEDYKGRMWFHGYSGELSYFEDDQIIEYPFNGLITNFLNNNYIHEIFVDAGDNLVISPMGGGISKFYSNGDIEHLDVPSLYMKYCYFFINDFTEGAFTSILSREVKPIILDTINTINQYWIPLDYKRLNFHRYCLRLDENTHIFSYGNELYLLRQGMIVNKIIYQDQVAGLMLDAAGNLWVTLMYGQGVQMYPGADLDRTPRSYFKGKTITKAIQDREGNYWFSSVGEGLLFVPSLEFMIYKTSREGHELNILSMDRYEDDLYVSTIDKKLYKFDISGQKAEQEDMKLSLDLTNWIFDIEADNDGYVWIASSREMRMDSLGFPRPPDTLITIFEIEEGQQGRILIGSNYLGIYEDGDLRTYPSDQFRQRIHALHEDREGRIWLATLSGLYRFNEGNYEFMGKNNEILGKRINCIASIRDYMILGSGSQGIIFFRGDSVQLVVGKDEGLVSDAVNELYFDRDSTLWVGTNHGLSKIVFTDPDSLIFEIDNFTFIDGLPAHHINEIIAYRDHIWLGTDQGLITFNPDNIKDADIPPLIRITAVRINNRDTTLQDEYVLESHQNNIRVYFKSVSFKGQDNIIYRYLMWNLNEEIILTNNTYVDFPNLPNGDYTFLVNAGFKDGIWNESPQFIHIRIKKHFTETLWFISLVSLAGLLLISFVVFKVFQSQRRKEERKKELIMLENKFFRSQLNPHFIFNALLAIQSFIYKKEPDEAVRYLTSFARLIRYILSIADEESISLDKELQFIRNYLELQRLRFSSKFEYKIQIEKSINPEMIQVPPLLAQPFIENAIEHGLQYKPAKGKLHINLFSENHDLILEVVDDGIGREASQRLYEKRNDKPKSFGMSIIEQRIALMNKIMDNNIEIRIEDMVNQEGPTGTKVNIRIPLVNNQ